MKWMNLTEATKWMKILPMKKHPNRGRLWTLSERRKAE